MSENLLVDFFQYFSLLDKNEITDFIFLLELYNKQISANICILYIYYVYY